MDLHRSGPNGNTERLPACTPTGEQVHEAAQSRHLHRDPRRVGGSTAAGVAAQSSRGSATAINEQGGTIRTHGDGASGLFADVLQARIETDVPRAARAENHGTVIATGDIVPLEDDEQGNNRNLIAAGVEASADVGSATVLNTGNVTASGSVAVGLLAHDGEYGDGGGADVEVRMTGGRVVAGRRDNPATAEDESGAGFGIAAWTDSGDAEVTVSGDSTTVTAHGVHTDDPSTELRHERGVGISAGGFETGSASVEVSGGATVTAGTAVDIHSFGDAVLNLFESRLDGRVVVAGSSSSNNRFTVRGGTVDGDVDFLSGGNDVLTIEGHGRISGDVDFGGGYHPDDGTDTIVFDVTGTGEHMSSIEGTVTGVEKMYKRGSGTARLQDVIFSGSALDLEQGGLTLAGHLDLGEEGTLTVHDESRLTIEVGDITADDDDHGRITAGGGVIFDGLDEQDSPGLFMQIGADAVDNRDDIQATLQQEAAAIDVLGGNTRVRRRTDADSQPVAAETILRTVGEDGTTRDIGTLSDDGTAVVELDEGESLGVVGMPAQDATASMCRTGEVGTPPNCRPAPRTSDDDGSDVGAILIGSGAVAALAVYLFDLFDSEEPAFAGSDESWTGSRSITSFAGIQSGHYHEHRVRTGALDQWTRAFADGSSALAGGVEGTVRGIAFGWDAALARGFDIGVSMMPEMAVSARGGPALDTGASVEGGRYALRAGWRGSSVFVDTTLSHGRYRLHSFMENPVAGGLSGGDFSLTQNHAHGRAGMRFDIGRIRTTPSVSLFSGSLRQGSHTARGAAVSAEVPGFSRHYAGWRARLDLAPSGWLDGPGALRWRPSLHLGTTHTRTDGPGNRQVRQSDHDGVLSFASRAVAKDLPRSVHGIGASVTAARSEAWNFRMGYAGMVVDGEPVHAAVARLTIRF